MVCEFVDMNVVECGVVMMMMCVDDVMDVDLCVCELIEFIELL